MKLNCLWFLCLIIYFGREVFPSLAESEKPFKKSPLILSEPLRRKGASILSVAFLVRYYKLFVLLYLVCWCIWQIGISVKFSIECAQRTLTVGESITGWLISSLAKLDSTTTENLWLLACSESAESQLVKLESSCTVIISPMESVPWCAYSLVKLYHNLKCFLK